MRELGEKESLDFLEKFGFKIVERAFFLTRFGLKSSLRKVGIDSIMKISGKNFPKEVSKKTASNFKTYTGALEDFKNLKKIKGLRGVLLKKKVKGKEFFVTVKRNGTPNPFLSFSSLELNEENQKGIPSKSFPITKAILEKMIKEAKFPKTFSMKLRKNFEEFVMKLCQFFQENSSIKSIEISSLFVNEKSLIVVNARIISE